MTHVTKARYVYSKCTHCLRRTIGYHVVEVLQGNPHSVKIGQRIQIRRLAKSDARSRLVLSRACEWRVVSEWSNRQSRTFLCSCSYYFCFVSALKARILPGVAVRQRPIECVAMGICTCLRHHQTLSGV